MGEYLISLFSHLLPPGGGSSRLRDGANCRKGGGRPLTARGRAEPGRGAWPCHLPAGLRGDFVGEPPCRPPSRAACRVGEAARGRGWAGQSGVGSKLGCAWTLSASRSLPPVLRSVVSPSCRLQRRPPGAGGAAVRWQVGAVFFAPSRCYSDCEPGRAATPRHVAAVSTAAARRVCEALSGTGAPRGCAGAGGSGAGLPPRSPAGRRAVRCLPALGSFLRRAAGGAREGRCQVPGVDFGGVAGFPLTGMDAQPCSRQGVGTASNAVEQSNDSGT